jgi:hypothetical protein
MGAYRWVEARLFEVMGGWTHTVPEAEVKLEVAAHAREHAWHAELWDGQLPGGRELVPERLVAPANQHLVELVEALAEPQDEGQTIEKLVGVYRVVVPRLVSAYSGHLANTSPASDGPVGRALILVRRDEVDHWQRGEALVQSLLRTDDHVQRAAARQAHLERIVTAAGGITGELDPWRRWVPGQGERP